VLVVVASVFQIRVVNTGWVPGAKRDVWLAAEAEKAEAEKAAEKAAAKAAAEPAVETKA